MIDLKALRDNPEQARASQTARGEDPGLVDELLAADARRRDTLQAFESLRAQQNQASRKIGKASPEERPGLVEQTKELTEQVRVAESEANAAQEHLDELLYTFPNLILEGIPPGGEDDYVVLKTVGEPRDFDAEGIQVRDHLELGEGLGAIDTERGAKVSGSRFYFLTGVGARLELGLLNLAMDTALAHGFTPMITPTLVRPEIMAGTGFLGEHADEVYRLERDDLYLVGTSEVSLAGYHKDEIIDVSAGPIRYAGWSACYRREAGSHGRDTRGIIRVHQFHKVEMFSFVSLDQAEQEHDAFLALEEEMLAKVELPYRVIDTAAGDLGDAAARKYDCEAWLPSQERFLEMTSTSNCTTFQARRLGVRTRAESGTTPVATVNGTLATTRWIVAMLENHQQADGSVHLPQALRPYFGGVEKLEPR
ncbi:MAG TPA: serine--tRNA ligase [Beutenbergiaceae bacterium]|nr:serine--tRNA ligase [Beutenbergiaceae bacterium]